MVRTYTYTLQCKCAGSFNASKILSVATALNTLIVKIRTVAMNQISQNVTQKSTLLIYINQCTVITLQPVEAQL